MKSIQVFKSLLRRSGLGRAADSIRGEDRDQAVSEPLRQSLVVDQTEAKIHISVTLASGARVVALWARQRGSGWLHISDAFEQSQDAASGEIRPCTELTLNLMGRISDSSGGLTMPVDGKSVPLPDGAEQIFDPPTIINPESNVTLFLEVECHESLLWTGVDSRPLASRFSTGKSAGPTTIGVARTEGREGMVRARVRLGGFQHTSLGPLPIVSARGQRRQAYVNRDGNLVIAVNRELQGYGHIHLNSLGIQNGELKLEGAMETRHRVITGSRLVLLSGISEQRFTADFVPQIDENRTSLKFGLRNYTFTVKFPLGWLLGENMPRADDVLTAWVETTAVGEEQPHRARLGRARTPIPVENAQGWVERNDTTLSIHHYYTPKADKSSFVVEVFDRAAHQYLREGITTFSKSAQTSGPVWLIGELPYKAQDNGLHFFWYVSKNHPEIDAYYVIDTASPEMKNLAGLDNIVHFRSKKHIELFFRAERFIGSHHIDYLYPSRAPLIKQAATGTKIFLQHGVMGTKWMVPNYGKDVPGFDTDLVLVSSEREKELIVSDFGYDADEVAVTGLSRFDTLLAGDVEVRPNQLLIIPTWRDWLGTTGRFLESDYFRAWYQLLRHERLRALAEDYDLEIIFSLHPNMQRFRTHFMGAPVKVVAQGEIDVQYLLKQSAIMITDFSSVGFDFSFLHKPVIYYQFDQDEFIGSWGSHLDLEAELPGPIHSTLSGLIEELQDRIAAECEMASVFKQRADRFLTYRDTGSNERIFSRVVAEGT